MDAILEGADEVNDFPEQQTLPGLCRTSVLITENEMKALASKNIERLSDYQTRIIDHN